jgi:hypothetical protein
MPSLFIGCVLLICSEASVIAGATGTDGGGSGDGDAVDADDGSGDADVMGTDDRVGAANAKGIGWKTILGSATTMAMDWSESDSAFGVAALAPNPKPKQPRLPVPPQRPTNAASRLIPLAFFPIPCCSCLPTPC